MSFGGRIAPSKREVGPIPLNVRRKSLPGNPTIYDYARSKEGQEEQRREIQEAQLMLGVPEEEVSGALAAEGRAPAPRAPQVEEQSAGLPTTPVLVRSSTTMGR